MSIDLEREHRLEQAIQFIVKAALNNDIYPHLFLLHSIRVGLYLQDHGYAEEIVLAGFLHDVVEDTPVSLTELQTIFGDRVTQLVAGNTHNMELPRLERDRESLERCLQIGEAALLVKAADKRDNLQSYLHSADPEMMDWLRSNLQDFLDQTEVILGHQPVWQDIREQYETLSSS